MRSFAEAGLLARGLAVYRQEPASLSPSRACGRTCSASSSTSISAMADDLATQVAAAIAELRPYLERSGAKLELVGVEEGIAHVTASVGRQGFLLSNLSFVAGVERALRERVPNLRGVAAINLPPYAGVGWDKPDFAGRVTRLDSGGERG